eukprot:scaffold206627_cov27-Attheya_sp.AAC.2
MRRRENVPTQSDEACWGAPSFFSLHPVGVYMGIGTVSELMTQSAYLLQVQVGPTGTYLYKPWYKCTIRAEASCGTNCNTRY